MSSEVSHVSLWDSEVFILQFIEGMTGFTLSAGLRFGSTRWHQCNALIQYCEGL